MAYKSAGGMGSRDHPLQSRGGQYLHQAGDEGQTRLLRPMGHDVPRAVTRHEPGIAVQFGQVAPQDEHVSGHLHSPLFEQVELQRILCPVLLGTCFLNLSRNWGGEVTNSVCST